VTARPVPAVVWGLLAVHALLLASWALVVPAYRAPDEPQHLDMVFALRSERAWPGPGERAVTQQIRRSQDRFPLRGFDGGVPDTWPLPGALAPPRAERPSYAEVAADGPSDANNQQWQHPPLYYATVALVLTMVPGADGWAFDKVLLLARLASAAMVLPLPALAWAAARRLGAAEPLAVTAAALTLAVPQATHIGASVNNDALLVLFGGAVTVVAAAVGRGDTRLRTAATGGLLAAGGMLAKGFGLVLPAVLTAAYGLAWWRARSGGRQHGRPVLVAATTALGTAALLGGPWYVRNLLRFGTLQPSGARFAPVPEGFAPNVGDWLVALGPRIVQRFWGEFGLLQAPMPPVVVVACAIGLAGAVALAFARRPDGSPDRWSRADLALLLSPLAGTALITAYGSWGYYVESATFPGMQGRYLFPGLVGLAVVAALGVRAVPAAGLAVALAVQAVGLHTALRFFWGEPGGGLGASVAGALAWAPLPAVVTVAAVAGAFGVGAVLVVALTRARLRPAPSEAEAAA
jgi:hypothetical protein